MMIRSRINPHGVAEFFPKLVATGHRAGERPADTDDRFARSMLAEPGIKSHQFKNIDRFEIKPFGDPGHPAFIDESKVILPEMKQWKGGAPFGNRVVRHSLVDFGKKIRRDPACLRGA